MKSKNIARLTPSRRDGCSGGSLFLGIALVMMLAIPGLSQELAPILAKMPAPTVEDDIALADQILKGGVPSISAIIQKLMPPGEGDDVQARYALESVVRRAGRPGAQADRKTVADALAQSTARIANTDILTFLINQFQKIGGEESVPALAAFLKHDILCDHAAAALAQIGTAGAKDAIAAALPDSNGRCRLTLVLAAGYARVSKSIPQIAKSVQSDDPALAEGALWALANMGHREVTAQILHYIKQAQTPLQRAKGWSLYALACKRIAETGAAHDAAQAALAIRTITDSKIRDAAAPYVNNAMLRVAAACDPDSARPMILADIASDDVRVRAAALDASAALAMPDFTTALVKAMGKLSPPAKADLLARLALRSDKVAIEGVSNALKDADPTVRVAAAAALVKLSGESALPTISEVLQKAAAEDAKPLAEIVARMPGEKPLAALGAALAAAGPEAKVAILEVLAARIARSQKAAILAQIQAEQPAVRVAAMKAVEKIATADDVQSLVQIALDTKDDALEAATFKAAIAAALTNPDPANRADPLVGLLPASKGPKRIAHLRAIAKVGGPKALDVVVKETRSDDRAVREGAIRALAEWSDPSAAKPLLEIAQAGDTPANQKIIALRGAVTVTKNATAAPAAEKVKIYAQAMTASTRPDEKKLVLGALSAEHTPEALALAAAAIDDDALKAEASLATIKIIIPDKGAKLTGPKVIAALKKAIPLCPDPKAKAEAQKHLSAIDKK